LKVAGHVFGFKAELLAGVEVATMRKAILLCVTTCGLGALSVALNVHTLEGAEDDSACPLLGSQSEPRTGYIVDWLVCGPFFRGIVEDYEHPQQPPDDHLAAIGGEARAQPFPHCSFLRGRVWFDWVAAHSENHVTDFLPEFSYISKRDSRGRKIFRYLSSPCMYAACYLESARRVRARLKVWTAGQHSIYIRDIHLGGGRGDQAYECELTPGRNRLLLKVAQNAGRFRFKVGIELPSARELNDVKVRLRPSRVPRVKLPKRPTTPLQRLVEHPDGYKLLFVNAPQFRGEHRRVVVPERKYYHHGYYKLVDAVVVPESGEVSCEFDLPEPPRSDEQVRDEFVLKLWPLDLWYPWICEERDDGSVLDPPNAIEVNGHQVNRIVKPDGRGIGVPEFAVPVKPEFLRAGRNQLAIRVVDPERARKLARSSPLGFFHIQHMALRIERFHDFSVTRVPRLANRGENFYVKLLTLRPHELVRVECPESVEFLGKLPRELLPGERRLYFRARHADARVRIALIASDAKTEFVLPRITDVRRHKPEFCGFVCTSSDSSRLVSHKNEISCLKDLDLFEKVQMRAGFSRVPSRKVLEAITRLYAREKMYVNFGYDHLRQTRLKDADFERWGGKYYHGGRLGSGHYLFERHRWPDMRAACEAYLKQLRTWHERDPRAWIGPCLLFHRFFYEAGFRNSKSQYGYNDGELLLSTIRGAARAYGDPPWAVTLCDDCSVIYSDNPRYYRMVRVLNFISFLSGADYFMPEISTRWVWIGYALPWNRGHLDHMHEWRRLQIEKEFYDFIRTHPRPAGPVARLGFVQGNLDGWAGARAWYAKFVWNNPDWPWDTREEGWQLLKVVFPDLKFKFEYPMVYPKTQQHWTTDTPYGKVDLVPSKAPVEVLNKYAALFVPGWHTMDSDHYERFKQYVANGGMLLMAVPQVSAEVRRDVEPKPWRGGRISDVFGVRVAGKGKLCSQCVVKEDMIFGLAGFHRRAGDRIRLGSGGVHVADVQLTGARVVVADTQTGAPLLTDYPLGKGHAYLLTTWAYPGEPALRPLMTKLIAHLAEATAGPIRVRGSETINYGVFCADGRWGRDSQPGDVLTSIYLVDIDWWTLGKKHESCTLSLHGRDIELGVPSGDILQVVYYRDLAIVPDDKMIYIEKITQRGDAYQILAQGAGTHELRIYTLGKRAMAVQLDGRPVQFKHMAQQEGITLRIVLTGRNVLSLIVH